MLYWKGFEEELLKQEKRDYEANSLSHKLSDEEEHLLHMSKENSEYWYSTYKPEEIESLYE